MHHADSGRSDAPTATPAGTATPVNTATPAGTATPVNTATPVGTATPAGTATPVGAGRPACTGCAAVPADARPAAPARPAASPQPAAPGGAPSRRAVLRGAAAAGAGALGLAACSSSGDSSAPASAGPVDLGEAAAVPVGGGVVHRDDRIVVTQPAKGEFKAFSARCTHAGCIVDKVADGLIQCPCHGSRFRIADGSVADGPAPRPLPTVPVAVRGGRLVAGG